MKNGFVNNKTLLIIRSNTIFNVSQWDNFTKRISVYMIIGIGGLFFMENSVLFMMIATLIDLVCQLIRNKWEEFEKEFDL